MQSRLVRSRCRRGTTNASSRDYRTPFKEHHPMKKLLSSIGLTFMLAFTLTGCELYFGKSGGSGGGDDTPGNPPGWACDSNADCAAGCFCEKADGATSGTCAEAGFCDDNADCPEGYVCDDRSSCVPGDPPKTCTQDLDCDAGSYCNNGTCETTCVCSSDAEAQAAGWNHCDEIRMTCKPANTFGTCGGAITGGQKPNCPQGSVPLTDANGAYTGECSAVGLCDVAPACERFQHEQDCLDTSDGSQCTAAYTGINCTKPDGTACQSGDTGCTCESFKFAECR
jgi:hypothetical protein